MPLSRKQKRSAGAWLVRPRLHRPGRAGLQANKLSSTAPLKQQQAPRRWRKTKSLPTRLHRAAHATQHITRDWMLRCQRPRKTSSRRALRASLDVAVNQKRNGSQRAFIVDTTVCSDTVAGGVGACGASRPCSGVPSPVASLSTLHCQFRSYHRNALASQPARISITAVSVASASAVSGANVGISGQDRT